jgi:hypothetical protein
VTDFTSKSPDHKIRRPNSGRDAISAVKFSEALTAAVDAWAEAHEMARSDAIRKLVELGLLALPGPNPAGSAHREPVHCEDLAGVRASEDLASEDLASEVLAVRQIDQLLDPSLPPPERERRTRRLTEGPPEFADERIDLPKSRE